MLNENVIKPGDKYTFQDILTASTCDDGDGQINLNRMYAMTLDIPTDSAWELQFLFIFSWLWYCLMGLA